MNLLERLVRPDLCIDCPRRNTVQLLAGTVALPKDYIAPNCDEQGPFIDAIQLVLHRDGLVNDPVACGEVSNPEANQIDSGHRISDLITTEAARRIRLQDLAGQDPSQPS